MRKILGISTAIACMLAYCAFGADRLVVTRTGKSFWVTSVKQVGDQVKYVHRDTRQPGTVPVSELHGVVPTVQRGKIYKPEEVQKYIDRAEKLIKLHGNLYRQLNVILQEWKALQNPPEGLADDITSMEAAFESSDKGPHAYKMIALDLSMVKFKDVGGHFSRRIESILERAKQEYIATTKQRIAEMAATEGLSVDEYVDMKELAKTVMEETGDADSEEIEGMVSAAREAVYLATCQKSMQILRETRSVDGYLECVRILKINKEQIAANDTERATIDRGQAKLLAGIKNLAPQYRFNESGYPLSQDDVQLMGRMAPYMSRITFVGSDPDVQCLIVPEQQPGRISLRGTLSVPLRLILNRGQKPGRELALGVKLLGADEDRYARLGPVEFTDGHASIVLRKDFSDLPDDFTLMANEDGETLVYVYLAYLRNRDAKEGQEDWVIMSRCCGWRISP